MVWRASTRLFSATPGKILWSSCPAASSNLLIQVTDAAGHVVAQLTKSKGSGPASLPVSVAHLAKGKYYVSVYNKGVLLGTRELLKL